MEKSRHIPLAILLLAAIAAGCTPSVDQATDAGDPQPPRPRVAYVTNGIASFWNIAEVGALRAGRELGVDVEVRHPPNGVEDQKRMVQVLLAQQIDGIAISPIDPENQADLLDEIADRTRLITQDSDAPESRRLCYIGMDNYTAGRLCGQLVKEALPDGGTVIIFLGRLGQANARLRRQGVIDELLDRSFDPTRYDDPNVGEQVGTKYTVVDTRTDGFDFVKAKALAEDALTRYPDLNAMIGLFGYNSPCCLEVLREAGRVGQVQIIAFDEDETTLDGIARGEIYGTVVQNPFQYGYESVRVLSELARGNDSVIPPERCINIPARQIRHDNVAAFQQEMEDILGSSEN